MFESSSLVNSALQLYKSFRDFVGVKDAIANNSHTPLPEDIEPRGARGRLERLPTLEAEGRDDFLTGFRNWRGTTVQLAARNRFNKILSDSGFNPKDDIPLEKIHSIIENDPVIGAEGLMRIYSQRFAHRNFYLSFADDADKYLDEMEKYEKLGPGSIHLDPSIDIPDYAKHEIHMQPGGYVGNPFAGHLYHYGTNAFYSARARDNYQDQYHAKLAEQVPTPHDNKVTKILDLGCGIGQFAVALKERYPEAEVWGLEVSAPMLRYGHMRAVDQNVAVNFKQGLAEDTKFEDNSFDIVASYIIHHEMPADISRAIFAEAHRILRPGGFYFPIDFFTSGRRGIPGAFPKYQEWKDHRWNNEVWRMEYKGMDFAGDMEKAGFKVSHNGLPTSLDPYLEDNRKSVSRNICGTKLV
ncbi:MAG: class I SAM-dependent methyltransferase [Pseudomonadota bacterium]|nr:class I SAM-dependent methyltransferase [Pseudomonadota bacterium]